MESDRHGMDDDLPERAPILRKRSLVLLRVVLSDLMFAPDLRTNSGLKNARTIVANDYSVEGASLSLTLEVI